MLFLGAFLGADELSMPFTPTLIGDDDILELSGACFDGLFVTKDLDAEPNLLPSEWDYDTIMLAQFNDYHAEAGNYGWNLNNTSHLIVRRRATNEYDWTTIKVQPIHSIDDFAFDGIDMATESRDYEYAIFSYQQGAEGNYTSAYITSKNSDLVVADSSGTYTTPFTDGFCNTVDNAPSSVVTTLYDKYPTIIRNTNANYEEITVNASFLPNKNEEGECIPYDDVVENDAMRVLYQRQTKDFLSNGLPKILKNVDGQVWLVYITTPPSDSADTTYSDRKLTFSCTEIGSVRSEKDLCEAGLLDIPEEWWSNV